MEANGKRDPHPIQRYIDRHDLTQQQFVARARDLGASISQAHLSDCLAGKSEMSTRLAVEMERVTDGEVRAEAVAAWYVRRQREAA